VVEQVLKSTIQDDIVTLTGTSYSFIQKGEETEYNLDNYEFKVSDDGMHLKGHVADLVGVTGEIAFVAADTAAGTSPGRQP